MNRKLSTNVVNTAMALSTLCFLTAAKGAGCGGDHVISNPPPPEIDCPVGQHREQTCNTIEPLCIDEPSDEPSGGCESICVDDACPDGTFEQVMCFDPMPSDCGPHMECPPACERMCTPIDECGPGMLRQTVCSAEGSSGSGGCDEYGNCSFEEPTEQRCDDLCAPEECPAGEHLALECVSFGFGYPEGGEAGEGEAYPGEECYAACVADESIESTTVSVGSGGTGGGSGGVGGASPQ